MRVNHLRFPVAAGAGFLLTGSLFSVLFSMTNVKFDVQAIETVPIEFSRLIEDTATQETLRETPIERTAPPIQPQIALPGFDGPTAGGPVLTLAPPVAVAPIGDLPMGLGRDQSFTPIVRVNPVYPPRAAAREIEGWVQVQFNITEAGTVSDAIVVDSSPSGVFDEAAVEAILRWRYNPTVQDGRPVEVRGIQTLLRFTLE